MVVDTVLAELDYTFEAMYARSGRPSVPPETMLKASVLMARYSMRSERAFCERLSYDMVFKSFPDLLIDATGCRRLPARETHRLHYYGSLRTPASSRSCRRRSRPAR